MMRSTPNTSPRRSSQSWTRATKRSAACFRGGSIGPTTFVSTDRVRITVRCVKSLQSPITDHYSHFRMETARSILKKIRRLELKTRGLVAATFSGQYRSVFKGRGMNFEEVRQYQPG